MLLQLTATLRNGERPDDIRNQGNIPAVVYAPGMESQSLIINHGEFEKVFREAGESTIIELIIEGEKEPLNVLVQDLQMAPVKDLFLHVDFYKITAGQELSATVALQFIGEAPAVKAHGGMLMTQRDSIDVTCLPKDLVDHIEVDLSGLTDIGSNIHVSDLVIPEGITVVDDAVLLVATIAAPRVSSDEEETTEMSINDIQVEEKGKKEESAAE